MLHHTFSLIRQTTFALVSLSLTLFVSDIASAQAQRERTVANAVKAARDDGGMVAILLHGSDWNRSGEQFKVDIFDQPSLETALPSGVVLTSVDIKEEPTAADDKRAETVNKIPEVKPRTYPCVLILDGVGSAITLVQPVVQYENARALANELSKWHQRIVDRDRILVRARLARGVAQAALIGEALRAGGVGLGPRLQDTRKPALIEALDLMKKADPNDESGWIFATEFPFGKLVSSTNEKLKTEGLAAAEKEIDAALSNPHLTAEQRQELQRQRFLLYKDDNQPLARQIEQLRRVAAEAPDTVNGRGASQWASHLEAKAR